MHYDFHRAPRPQRRALCSFPSFLFLLISFCLPRLARAEQKVVTIPCPPGAIELPEGGLRAASDGDTWEFLLAPQTGVTVWDQQWTFNNLNPNATGVDPAWGSFGGGNGSNSLSWISPTAGGTYGIKVRAKRKCGGGIGGGDGPPIDENFEVNWDVDVEAVKTWTTPSALTAAMASPAPNLLVVPSTPVACSVTASDSDHWKIGDAPGAEEGDDADDLKYNWSASGGFLSGSGASVQWTPPNAAGTYTISCIVDDAPKDLGPLDGGTRDDAPVTVSVSVIVPPRTWSAGAAIGAVLNDKGKPVMDGATPILNGRVLTPQDQTVPKPQGQNEYPVIKVRPGEDVACLVEAATDWDHWKREGVGEETDANFGSVHGDEKDEVTYLWSANGGEWRGNKTDAAAATWKAPAAIQNDANDNTYTLTCTLDDKPTAVAAPDTPVGNTARGDAPVPRTIKVKVVDGTSWMGLGVYRNQTDASPAAGPIGGTAWIAVDVQVGGLTTFAAPGAIRLRVQEHDGEGLHHEADNHAWLSVPETGWVEWNFDAANNGQNPHWGTALMDLPRANGNPTPRRFRRFVDWNTTATIESADPDGADPTTGGPLKAGKLWGHNASHTVELEYSDQLPDGNWIVKHEAEFQPEAVNGVAGVVYPSGPTRIGADVGNLVITNVVTNAGNSDYFKFDDASTNLDLKKPPITFTIADAGDAHRYKWEVRVRDTRNDYEDSVVLTGTAPAPGTYTVRINAPEAGQTQKDPEGEEKQLEDWGTYAFDIYVKEVTAAGAPLGDEQYLRGHHPDFPYPGKLDMADTMYDEESERHDGHYFKIVYDELQNRFALKIGYRLEDEDDLAASAVRVDLVDPELTLKTFLEGLPTQIDANHSADLYAFGDDDKGGEYIAVFMAQDNHAREYRDHTNKGMLARNQRTVRKVLVIEEDYMTHPQHGALKPHAFCAELKGAFGKADWEVNNADQYVAKGTKISPDFDYEAYLTDSERATESAEKFYFANRFIQSRTATYRVIHVIGAAWADGIGNHASETGQSDTGARWSYTFLLTMANPPQAGPTKSVTIHEVSHQLGTDDNDHPYDDEKDAVTRKDWVSLSEFKGRLRKKQDGSRIPLNDVTKEKDFLNCVAQPGSNHKDWDYIFCIQHEDSVRDY